MKFTEMLEIQPYSLNKREKSDLLTEGLSDLTRLHYKSCEPFRNILDALDFDFRKISTLADIPFLPVRLLKSSIC